MALTSTEMRDLLRKIVGLVVELKDDLTIEDIGGALADITSDYSALGSVTESQQNVMLRRLVGLCPEVKDDLTIEELGLALAEAVNTFAGHGTLTTAQQKALLRRLCGHLIGLKSELTIEDVGRALSNVIVANGGGSRTLLLDYSTATFTRASTGYETQADGSLIQRANDVLRRSPSGDLVLLEAGMTNSAQMTEDWTNARWVKTNCTIANSPFSSPAGTTARSIVATAGGDAYITEQLFIGMAQVGRVSIYVKSDGGPQTVTLTLFFGVTSESTTVVTTDSWQRITVVVPTISSTPSLRVGIMGAAAGAKVSLWGAQFTGSNSVLRAPLASYFPSEFTNATSAQDFLTIPAVQVPARMLDGTGGAWAFDWVPNYDFPDDAGVWQHTDTTFFSCKNLSFELLFAPARATVTDVGGPIWLRAGPDGSSAAWAWTDGITFSRGQLMSIHVSPSTGKIRVIGATTGGTQVSAPAPWSWPAGETITVGERNLLPGTHPLDGWISEPYAIEPF